jgi:choline dehydrogenase
MNITSDYIVVGAGSSGSVVTRRLLDAGFSVHVIEAGPSDDNAAIHNAQGWPALLHSPEDWNVTTIPQRHAGNRRLYWPRGKVLGGSSSMNGLIYVRGHRSDYDGWAAEGCTGWDFDSVLPLFRRSEDHVDGASEWHGAGGPLPVERITNPHPTSMAFVEAAVGLGFRSTNDFNGGQMIGVGYNQTTSRAGRRASAWRSFVGPVLGHPDLTVTTSALVHRVMMRTGRAIGVEYSIDGTLFQALADAEVIVSAGTIGSPKLLLLSGIGPAAHIRQHGLAVVADLPGVGENLHDHLLVSNVYESSRPLPPGQHNLLESQLFTTSLRWSGSGPDLQPVFLHIVYPAEGYPIPEHGYTIAPGIVRPQSRGRLQLASSDPTAMPLCDPNVLAESYDMDALIDAVEICREIGAAQPFQAWRRAEISPGPEARNRAALRAYVRRAVGTYHHQVGTCRMGVGNDAVVAPDLRVRGLAGLRVADASIIPAVPSGNTNAPSIMIGEKAADLILGRKSVGSRARDRSPQGSGGLAARQE